MSPWTRCSNGDIGISICVDRSEDLSSYTNENGLPSGRRGEASFSEETSRSRQIRRDSNPDQELQGDSWERWREVASSLNPHRTRRPQGPASAKLRSNLVGLASTDVPLFLDHLYRIPGG